MSCIKESNSPLSLKNILLLSEVKFMSDIKLYSGTDLGECDNSRYFVSLYDSDSRVDQVCLQW